MHASFGTAVVQAMPSLAHHRSPGMGAQAVGLINLIDLM